MTKESLVVNVIKLFKKKLQYHKIIYIYIYNKVGENKIT